MSRPLSINRACEECKRKKTRCDGQRPICSLCERTCSMCVYPRRKPRERDQRRRKTRNTGDTEAPRRSDAPSANAEQDDALDEAILNTLYDTSTESGELNLYHEIAMSSDMLDRMSNFGDTTYSGVNGTFRKNSDQDLGDLTQPILDLWNNQGDYSFDTFPACAYPGTSNSARSNGSTPQSIAPSTRILQGGENGMGRNSISGVAGPSMPAGGETQRQRYNLEVPYDVVDDLVDLYFRRVQVFLPLFHLPRFHETYLQGTGETKYHDLTKETALIFYGMMALSARFSLLPYFHSIKAKERGVIFAQRAEDIVDKRSASAESSTPTLELLQGCILLAYYNQSSKLKWGRDGLIKTCVQLSHDLNLHRTDEEIPNIMNTSSDSSAYVEEWISKEERRRAWWSVWELDTFDSVASRRTFTVDRNEMHVFLPVSDESWFPGLPVLSSPLDPDILLCWKSLRDSPNQDARAWFLISNYIMAFAHELGQHKTVEQSAIDDLETVVACFSLLFNERFCTSYKHRLFDDTTYARNNWICLTQLMVQSSRLLVALLTRRPASEPVLSGSNHSLNKVTRPAWRGLILTNAGVEHFYQPVNEVFRILRVWPPEYIRYIPPTMSCLIPGPVGVVLKLSRHWRKGESVRASSHASIEEELINLVLSHFAHYWNIGVHVLSKTPYSHYIELLNAPLISADWVQKLKED